jgi:4-aminobutyrate aminotransferase
MADTFSMIGDVRGKGLLMGMELLKDPETAERAIEEAEGVMYAALTKGLNFKITMGNILTLTPPLMINEVEMNAALDILQESLHEVFAR